MRRWPALLMLMLLTAFPAFAADDPRAFVEQYVAATRQVRGDAGLAPEQKAARTRALLHEAYDFVGAPKAILGRRWAKATADQQRRYLEHFEEYLIVAYGRRFDEVAQGLAVTGTSEAEGRTVVHSASTDGKGEPTRIDFVLTKPEPERWRIADVVVDGIGSVETMRQEFASVLRANHDDIEGLLAALRQRTEAVKAGGG